MQLTECENHTFCPVSGTRHISFFPPFPVPANYQLLFMQFSSLHAMKYTTQSAVAVIKENKIESSKIHSYFYALTSCNLRHLHQIGRLFATTAHSSYDRAGNISFFHMCTDENQASLHIDYGKFTCPIVCVSSVHVFFSRFTSIFLFILKVVCEKNEKRKKTIYL